MLDRLPAELLDLILQLLAPGSLHGARRSFVAIRALWACCLVCRKVKERAQPLLWHTVVVRKGGNWRELARVDRRRAYPSKHLWQYVRRLCVYGSGSYQNMEAQDAQGLIGGMFDRLEEASLNSMRGAINLHGLAASQHLRSLTLSDLDLPSRLRKAMVFPTLTELSLIYNDTTFSRASRFPLDEETFPSLRALSLVQGSSKAVRPSQALVAQLDMLQSTRWSLVNFTETPSVPHLLLLHSYDFDNVPDVRLHLALPSFSFEDSDLPPEDWEVGKIRDLVLSAAPPPSLLIPVSLDPEGEDLRDREDKKKPFERLVAACEERGVPIVWQTSTNSEVVSRDFWAYAKKLKAAAAPGPSKTEPESDAPAAQA